MDLDELRALARQTYDTVDPRGKDAAEAQAKVLTNAGIVAGAHVGDPPHSFDETRSLEWALGQFVQVVDDHAWFAMNSTLHKLHELVGDADA